MSSHISPTLTLFTLFIFIQQKTYLSILSDRLYHLLFRDK
nr:MAG TPA: apolipoprotein [Caudoviricetes sp.]